MMKKKWIIALLVLLLVTLIPGLVFYYNIWPPKKYHEDVEISWEQRIEIQLTESPATLDPQQAFLREELFLVNGLYEGLVRLTDGERVEKGEGLAQDWAVNEEGLVYEFILRDASWSNGSPITAEDVYNGWIRVLELGEKAPYGHLLNNIRNVKKYKSGEGILEEVGIDVVDEKRLRVELEEKDEGFLHKLAHPVFFPIPSRIMGEEEGLQRQWQRLMFSGPFRLKHWEPYQRVVLEKNPYYWDRGRVTLNTVGMHIINEPRRIVEAFDKREVDVIQPPIQYLSRLQGIPGFYLHERYRLWGVYFNVEDPRLRDPSIHWEFQNNLNHRMIEKTLAPRVSFAEIERKAKNGKKLDTVALLIPDGPFEGELARLFKAEWEKGFLQKLVIEKTPRRNTIEREVKGSYEVLLKERSMVAQEEEDQWIPLLYENEMTLIRPKIEGMILLPSPMWYDVKWAYVKK